MAEIKEVTELPVLDQADFLPLPEDFTGKNYVVYQSKWGKCEAESLVAALLTMMAYRHKWEPIKWVDFMEHVNADMVRKSGFIGRGPSNAAHIVADTGDIELIKFGGEQYIVPKPA